MIVSFDLHVDDEIQVKQYGNIYGFTVYQLKEENKNRTNELWDLICKINRLNNEVKG